MNTEQFNDKYKQFLEEGHYGLDISIPSVIEYLDQIFQELTKLPGFKYSQIKLKFNMARFYFNLEYKSLEIPLMFGIEDKINQLVKRYDDENKKEKAPKEA